MTAHPKSVSFLIGKTIANIKEELDGFHFYEADGSLLCIVGYNCILDSSKQIFGDLKEKPANLELPFWF